MTTGTRIVGYYAVWAALCAAVAGLVFATIHAVFFTPAAGLSIWSAGAGVVLAIAAGQGVVALLTGTVLARLGRTLSYTVLLGLVIGLFDFVMYVVQMAIPATELGWGPDLGILAAAAALITVLGAKKTDG